MDIFIDEYRNFDKQFFRSRDVNDSEEVEERVIQAKAEEYRELLDAHRDILEEVLHNREEPEALPEEVFQRLDDLREFERTHSTFMLHTIPQYQVEEIIKEFDLLEFWESKDISENNRFVRHLARLMSPRKYEPDTKGFPIKNEYCSTFGYLFFQYFFSLPKVEGGVQNKIDGMVGWERDEVCPFWSLSPYVWLDGYQRSRDPQKSVEKVGEWVVDAYERMEAEERLGVGESYMRHVQFYGIKMPRFNVALGWDERMPSHLLTRIMAKSVAREL